MKLLKHASISVGTLFTKFKICRNILLILNNFMHKNNVMQNIKICTKITCVTCDKIRGRFSHYPKPCERFLYYPKPQGGFL